MASPLAARSFAFGPEVRGPLTHFRVWAPAAARVEAVIENGACARLEPEGGGYFSGTAPAGPGARYRLRLDGGQAYPDPASPFQPEGPEGPSEIVDFARYQWRDGSWRGVDAGDAVLYELHVGTFTEEGTWAAAAGCLPELADLGVTVVEMMPVCEFAGRFGWGYDGVDWFAPTRLYGRPEDLMRLVDEAHRLGLGVILDVVYNHLGPVGNYLLRFSPEFASARYQTDWGPALNFDGPGSGPVREFVLDNARHWIARYHFDGLRLDATQNVCDLSSEHILAAVARAARAAAGSRRLLLVAENEPQRVRLLGPVPEGGYGFDAVWNDDFHHAAEVALTGKREGYYAGYRGAPQELVSALKRGFLYQGQHYTWQRKRRGTPAWKIPPKAFIHYLENHDQLGNAPHSARLIERVSPGRYRALLAVLLLGPQTPLLFQGQEFGSRAPFFFFADHEPELARRVLAGRRRFLGQFRSFAAAAGGVLADPSARQTWRSCVLDRGRRDAGIAALVRDLLRLRRADPVFRWRETGLLDGAVLGPQAFCLRWHGDGDRLLVVNLGGDLEEGCDAEPLLAPPWRCRWEALWSSQDPAYGGQGTPALEAPGWRLPAEIAVALKPASIVPVPGGDAAR